MVRPLSNCFIRYDGWIVYEGVVSLLLRLNDNLGAFKWRNGPLFNNQDGLKLLFYSNYGSHFNIKMPSIHSVQIFFPTTKVKKALFGNLCMHYGLNDLLRGSKWWILTLFVNFNEPENVISWSFWWPFWKKYAPSVDIFNLRGHYFSCFCFLMDQVNKNTPFQGSKHNIKYFAVLWYIVLKYK